MLTRFYVDNFRSFVNFEYKPEKKQLLLGANGSGKSSLLTAIRFLKQFVKADENPFTRSTRTRWQSAPLQVIEVDALLDGELYQYRVEMRFAADNGSVIVNSESLKVSGKAAFEFADGSVRFFSDDDAASKPMAFAATRSTLHLSQLSNFRVHRFVDWLDTVHCFQIDAYPGKMDESEDRLETLPDFELENFPGWYGHLLRAYPEQNLLFLNSLKETLDGFQAIRFSSEQDGVRTLRVDFAAPKHGKVSYSVSELSDGQRYLINLYAILHFVIARGHTVFIDEPDNFISLREIQPWLSAAEEMVEDSGGNLVLISHNPETLNQWAVEFGLEFFREENGQVRTRKFEAGAGVLLTPSELIARGWA